MLVRGLLQLQFGALLVSQLGESTGLEPKPVDIFCIPLNSKYLFYAPLQRVSALLNRAAVRIIRAGLNGMAQSEGALGTLLDALQAPGEPPPALRQDPLVEPFFLGLIPTRGCSLDCQYCDFVAPKQASLQMSAELARQAIDAYLSLLRSSRRRRLEIHFFGGEPFYAFETVFFAVEYARLQASQQGLETRFEVITNGMFDSQHARWIADHFDTVVLSLDGFAEVQERQRPALSRRPTYPVILRNARILAEGPTELALRACITQENVQQMPEFAAWAARELRLGSVCFETLAESPLSQRSGLLPADPYVFVQNFQAAQKVLEAQGIQTILSTDPPGAIQGSFCPVGKDALIVSPDGAVDACYWLEAQWQAQGLDLHLGQVDESGFVYEEGAVQRAREASLAHKEACQDCLCQYTCAGGCHVRRASNPEGRHTAQVCYQTRTLMVLRLLHELGQVELADAWLSERQAVEAMVNSASDRLESVEGLA